jgi:hypothetical protein
MYGATMNSLYWKALPLKIVLFIALYPVVGPWAFLLAPLALVSLVLITSHVSTESSKPKGGLNAHGVWKKSLDPPDARFGNYYDVDPDEDDQGRPHDRNGRVVKHSKPSGWSAIPSGVIDMSTVRIRIIQVETFFSKLRLDCQRAGGTPIKRFTLKSTPDFPHVIRRKGSGRNGIFFRGRP